MALLRWGTLALVMALPGCITHEPGKAGDPLTAIERWLTPDFAVDTFARRADRLAQVGPRVMKEMARAEHLAQGPGKLVKHEAEAVAGMPGRLADIAGREFARTPKLKSIAPMGTPDEVAARLAENLAGLPALLRLDRRPLGEHDDREHRTDPNDNRPEKSLGERLLRRLGL